MQTRPPLRAASSFQLRLLEAIALACRRWLGAAHWLEFYPMEPKSHEVPDSYAFTGVPAMFTAAGFKEIARRSPTRPILRCRL